MANSSSSSSGISFPAALGLLFIGLKLANVIQWSWLWVLCPFWIGLAIVAAIGIPILFVKLVAALVSAFSAKRRSTRRMRGW